MNSSWKSRGGGHRCTRVENPGEGVRDVFAKIPKVGQGFQEKIPGGSSLRFIAFLLTSFSKICLGGAVSYPPPPLTPPCVHLWGGPWVFLANSFEGGTWG